jgi:hypothetical protein
MTAPVEPKGASSENLECRAVHHLSDGDACPEAGCAGALHPHRIGDCSCHINPPCSACTDAVLTCDVCGWEQPEEPRSPPAPVSAAATAWWKQPRTWSKDLGDGKRLIDVDYDSRSGSTMVYSGRYEGPVTPADIIAALGDGTFGHRGPTLLNGRFTYTKITD